MNCIRCDKELQEGFIYCPFCGRKQIREKVERSRGNGTGTVYKVGNKYRAVVTLGYYTTDDGKRHRKTKAQNFGTKKEAIAALPTLANSSRKKEKDNISFSALYEKWLPTHKAGKDTMNCYKAAYKYCKDIAYMPVSEIDVDDLQECIDECGKGKRTQENIRTLIGLVYKYGIPRNCIPNNLNLAEYLSVGGESSKHKISFTDVQIQSIKNQIGKIYGAEYVYSLCYLGYRPSEFLSVKNEQYDSEKGAIFGAGSKTEAGINRTVTISPKIKQYIDEMAKTGEYLVTDKNDKPYTLQHFTDTVFYPVLEAAKIDNPVDENGRHTYTPHTCRHTFSTLMKNVQASSKDKMELIGHSSEEMLRYYQDVNLEDLKRITDVI